MYSSGACRRGTSLVLQMDLNSGICTASPQGMSGSMTTSRKVSDGCYILNCKVTL